MLPVRKRKAHDVEGGLETIAELQLKRQRSNPVNQRQQTTSPNLLYLPYLPLPHLNPPINYNIKKDVLDNKDNNNNNNNNNSQIPFAFHNDTLIRCLRTRPLHNKYKSDYSVCESVSPAIARSIVTSCRKQVSTALPKMTSIAARQYYLCIMDNLRFTNSFKEARLQIYNDLVIGTKSELNINDNQINHKQEEFELTYVFGSDSKIKTVSGSVLTVGRLTENDICTNDIVIDQSVSRIQLFIFKFNKSLIIFDGWSFWGTKVVSLNNKNKNLLSSIPGKRYILRFNENDTINLQLGDGNMNIIINPKECLVCMENAREIRNKCGHYALCKSCYDGILLSQDSICPICRDPLKPNISSNNSGSVATFAP